MIIRNKHDHLWPILFPDAEDRAQQLFDKTKGLYFTLFSSEKKN